MTCFWPEPLLAQTRLNLLKIKKITALEPDERIFLVVPHQIACELPKI